MPLARHPPKLIDCDACLCLIPGGRCTVYVQYPRRFLGPCQPLSMCAGWLDGVAGRQERIGGHEPWVTTYIHCGLSFVVVVSVIDETSEVTRKDKKTILRWIIGEQGNQPASERYTQTRANGTTPNEGRTSCWIRMRNDFRSSGPERARPRIDCLTGGYCSIDQALCAD
jgi:hypothetical protein